jgi:hypothetical protein
MRIYFGSGKMNRKIMNQAMNNFHECCIFNSITLLAVV